MILTEEGYITLNGTTPTYHYYLKDHLGNNRVVIDQSGTVEQVNHYYPFGGLFGEGTATTSQPYKYNDKELDRMHGLDWYDYGARMYDAALGRWHTVDPLTEKYFNISPYAYCANSPALFIDPNGQEIWIYYKDANGNQQKLQYTQEMEYKGDNTFVSSAITALNQMNSTEIGRQVLGDLVSSENQFNFTNTFAKDKNGNVLKDALSFEKSKNGGGEIYAGALVGDKMQECQKLETTAHELFHGYQYEKSQTMNGGLATVNNEVDAYLFGRGVYYSYNQDKGFGMMPWGNGTHAGDSYEKAMSSLIWGPSLNYSQYRTALNNFKAGSSVNVSKTGVTGKGLYKNFKVNTPFKNSLIKNFFPLVR